MARKTSKSRSRYNVRYELVVRPRTPGGTYDSIPALKTYVKTFATTATRERYWRSSIEPKTTSQPGPAFEFTKVDDFGSEWSYAGKFRYADDPILSGAPDPSWPNIIRCD